MHVELHCGACDHCFVTSLDADTTLLDQLREEDSWVALGDGETVEDRLFAELSAPGTIHCPHCGAAVAIGEDDLGRMSLELLEQW